MKLASVLAGKRGTGQSKEFILSDVFTADQYTPDPCPWRFFAVETDSGGGS